MQTPGLPAPPTVKQGDAPTAPRAACFSTHSRGVQLFDARLFCDCSAQWAAASSHLRDIASSLWYLLLIQSWLTVYALIVTICSVAFYCYVRNGLEGAALDWTSLAFAILLPTAGFTWWVCHCLHSTPAPQAAPRQMYKLLALLQVYVQALHLQRQVRTGT